MRYCVAMIDQGMFLSPPRPLYETDQPIRVLLPAELFVLCLARLWILHHRAAGGAPADWREGFAHMKIDPAGEAGFNELFLHIVAAPIKTLDIRCCTCGQLGKGEGWLLQLVGLLQHGRIVEAQEMLQDWLSPIVVARALTAAKAFAIGLAACSLSVSPGRPAAAVARRPMSAGRATCCSAQPAVTRRRM
jgi:hypothetical protein